MADRLAAAIVGAKRPTIAITWIKADGTPENLGASVLTGKILCVRSGVTRNMLGELTILNGAEGQFSWDYATEDVATSGLHYVQFSAAFPGDVPTPAKTFMALWYVEPAL